MSLFQTFFLSLSPKICHQMRLNTHIIIRILTVILLLTNVSGGGNLAYAAEKPLGSGTKEDPYIITSADKWDYFNSGTGNSDYICLGNDISVEKMIYQSNSFSGVFDGQGHTTPHLRKNCLFLSQASLSASIRSSLRTRRASSVGMTSTAVVSTSPRRV